MSLMESHDIFMNELQNCFTFEEFYLVAEQYFNLDALNLWDIYALICNLKTEKERQTYVQNHCFVNDSIKQEMLFHWFRALQGAEPNHQK